MSAYFITATGTDIGKTWLACALLRHWRAQGRQPLAVKPIQSGHPELPEMTDAGRLLAAMGRPTSETEVAAIAPWRFGTPRSPDQAAAAEGRRIDFDALVAFSRQTVAVAPGPTLVEGVGGVMVPLDAQRTVLDWMAACQLPAVLVAGSYLGSMSHTLTALAALRGAGVPVAAVVLNESADSTIDLPATAASLQAHIGAVPLVAVERAAPQAGIAALAALLS